MSIRTVFSCCWLACVAGVAISPLAVEAGDWTRFRGPNGSGISPDDSPAPTTWSPTENLQWKVALPGPGSSCPIVVGDRVYVTCWTGYGTDQREPGEQQQLRRHLLCLNRTTGQVLWDKSVEPVLPEDDYGGMFAQHGYASHTPVSDGERIYVYFGKSGALAFDLDGNQLWQTIVGKELDPHNWGSASSPILYKNLLIVTATAESEALVALDKLTGKEVWRQEASGFNGTWGTPVLVDVDANRTDLVIAVPGEIWGFNPETGKLAWYCEAMQNMSFCSSAVTDKGIVYAIESQGGGGSIAVRAGGKGDVTNSHVVWTGSSSNRIGTPVLYHERLYFISRQVVNCVDATNGQSIYEERLGGGNAAAPGAGPGGPGRAPGGQPGPGGQGPGGFGGGFGGRGGRGGGQDYASTVVADGKLSYLPRAGETHVIKLGDQFEKLASNRVTTDSEDFSASPTISNGELFLRSNKHLYCVATKGAE